MFVTRQGNALQLIIILAMMVAVVAFIILVERGERRIPVQYAKRVVGRRMMGGQSTHLPLKVNAGGVIPVIFASSSLAFPQTLNQVVFLPKQPVSDGHAERDLRLVAAVFCPVHRADHLLLFLLRFDHLQPNEAADNMRKYGGFIPGIRPGRTRPST